MTCCLSFHFVSFRGTSGGIGEKFIKSADWRGWKGVNVSISTHTWYRTVPIPHIAVCASNSNVVTKGSALLQTPAGVCVVCFYVLVKSEKWKERERVIFFCVLFYRSPPQRSEPKTGLFHTKRNSGVSKWWFQTSQGGKMGVKKCVQRFEMCMNSNFALHEQQFVHHNSLIHTAAALYHILPCLRAE